VRSEATLVLHRPATGDAIPEIDVGDAARTGVGDLEEHVGDADRPLAVIGIVEEEDRAPGVRRFVGEAEADEAIARLRQAIRIGSPAPSPKPVVIDRIAS